MEIRDKQPQVDWINLIEEAQTDPEELSGKAVQELYYRIYWYIESLANKWLQSRNLSETEDGQLLDIGTEKVLTEIGKFECQSDDSEIVRRQFFAWIAVTCKRRWSALAEEMAKDNNAYQAYMESTRGDDTNDDDRTLLRTSKEIARLQAILEKCLSHYTENMRQAILATMDLKDSVSSKKRGRTGETAIICKHYGVNPSTLRVYKMRAIECAKKAYAQEGK
ncbi:MAG: hypothetical protein JAY90_19560 [Candidatus Thiodiazotropha lotti]|nr:hypothetical protein [Candidatus Thiodiazotropha lotti]